MSGRAATSAHWAWPGGKLELEPWWEEAHRQLIRLLALSGRRSEALAQYVKCRRVLAEELGVEPSPETTGLYEQIRDQAPSGSLLSARHRRGPAHNLRISASLHSAGIAVAIRIVRIAAQPLAYPFQTDERTKWPK